MNAFALPHLDHGYQTVPQPNLGGRTIPYQRGKGLGGSTMINFTVWTRGPAADWDRWAKLVGDSDWAWSRIKDRYRQLETFHDKIDDKFRKYVNPDKKDHGYSGPIHVSIPETETEGHLLKTMDAGIEMGLPLNPDLNSGNELGISIGHSSLVDGLRIVADKLLIDCPKNLTVWTDAQVAKVLMERDTAVGVKTTTGRIVYATHEVILSAGGIDTPKILLLSGIGPREELQTVGIETIHELPGVGKNASDHLMVIICDMMGPNYDGRSEFDTEAERHHAALEKWKSDRSGPFAFYMKDSAMIFGKDAALEKIPEFQALPEEVREHIARSDVPTWEIATGGPLIPPTFTMPPESSYKSHVVLHMNPQSTGEVTLKSNDPSEPPLIDPKYLSNPYDRATLIAAVKAERQLMSTKTMQSHFKGPITAPASESDEDILAFIQQVGGPLWHFSSTAKMGQSSDKMAVVDSNLRVHGLKKLRVADISVCPFNPNAHTQAVAYVVGQTAAEKLIAEYELSKI
ncbi:hypothetical protein F5884DRAFT_769918 [Xylogone sp. PMI_703]|nr:hypothetical protein F5884DRAFT_769918 [Xylogone sp. PMI_703]